jgi:hypothetical protein
VRAKTRCRGKEADVDTDDKAEFLFTVWYFKPSGKFYTEASFRRVVRTCGPTRGAYMHDAVAHVRGLRDSGGQGALPGGGWGRVGGFHPRELRGGLPVPDPAGVVCFF